MKLIPLTQNKYAIVDDEDYESLNKLKWDLLKCANTCYARSVERINGKQKTVLMHHKILQKNRKKQIDHRDGNGLSNQRHNIRFCSISQNHMNSKKRKNTSSMWKGVYWDKKNLNWRGQIKINKKAICLGRFNDELLAAITYNRKAVELFGEFAKLNQIMRHFPPVFRGEGGMKRMSDALIYRFFSA